MGAGKAGRMNKDAASSTLLCLSRAFPEKPAGE